MAALREDGRACCRCEERWARATETEREEKRRAHPPPPHSRVPTTWSRKVSGSAVGSCFHARLVQGWLWFLAKTDAEQLSTAAGGTTLYRGSLTGAEGNYSSRAVDMMMRDRREGTRPDPHRAATRLLGVSLARRSTCSLASFGVRSVHT